MPRKPTLEHLPPAIHKELVAKVLLNQGRNHQETADWLEQQHGVKASAMTVHRFSRKILQKRYGLLQLDVPIDAIVSNEAALDLLGALLVQREILALRVDKLLALMMPAFEDANPPEADP